MSQIHEPDTVEDATGLLRSFGPDSAPLAGATWVMRERQRRQHYISLHRIDALRAVERTETEFRIGALATHAEIGELAADDGPLGALAEAARRSAFPAVRNVATLARQRRGAVPRGRPAAPLLAAEATLGARGGDARDRPGAVRRGRRRPASELIVAARSRRRPGAARAFERLTVRGGGEYSLACVAVSVDLAPDGT